ncbi:uncharacterized protein LOC116432838 [Nomia melanderi]|uniref:uncharacterized protein LOC116432838 n=1 Tax=Nomia melanderi TaxID=2448451 RepID=UPI003FCEA4E6
MNKISRRVTSSDFVIFLRSRCSTATENMYVIEREYKAYCVLLRIIGLWPFDHSLTTKIHRTLFTIVPLGCIATQVSLIPSDVTFKNLLLTMSVSFPMLIFSFRYVGIIYTFPIIRFMYENLQSDYETLQNPVELGILSKHAEISRRVFFVLLCACCTALLYGHIMLTMPVMLDLLLPLNETRPRMLHSFGFFVKDGDYINLISLYLIFAYMTGVMTVLCTESTFFLIAHYFCGLFQIANYRIKGLVDEAASTYQDATESTLIRMRMRQAVDMHTKAIEFVKIFGQNVGVPYLLAVAVVTVSMSINLYRSILAVLEMDEMKDMTISIICGMVHLMSVFMDNYIGQQISDKSMEMYYDLYETMWYHSPPRMRKVILLIMQRCSKECTIDFCGLFIPSYKGFATIMSSSFSYFTTICSLKSGAYKTPYAKLRVQRFFGRRHAVDYNTEADHEKAESLLQEVLSGLVANFCRGIASHGTSLRATYNLLPRCEGLPARQCVRDSRLSSVASNSQVTGLWPFNYRVLNIAARVVWCCTLLIFEAVQIVIHKAYGNNIISLIFFVSCSCTTVIISTKYITATLLQTILRNTMENMVRWHSLSDQRIVRIFEKYGERHRNVVAIYMYITVVSSLIYILVSIMPLFLDIVAPLNLSRSLHIIIAPEFNDDQHLYYYVTFVYFFVACLSGMVILTASDCLIGLLFCHHAAIFETVSYRIKNATDDWFNATNPTLENDDQLYRRICGAMDLYQRVQSEFKYIMTVVAIPYFIIAILMTICLCAHMFQLVVLLDSPDEFDLSLINALSTLLHLIYCYRQNQLSQKYVDHSLDVFYETYNIQWYVLPVRVQKLLLLILQGTSKGCVPVLAGLYVPSRKGFAMVLNKSFSYLAGMYSLRYNLCSENIPS